MRLLQPLLNFLELRPFFTLRSIRIFWWLYLAVESHRLYFQFLQIIDPGRHYYFQIFLNPVDTLLNVAATRLLLDVLLALVAYCTANFGERVLQRSRPAETVAGELRAFFDLAPFFTPRLIVVFWCLFLILQLHGTFSLLHPVGALFVYRELNLAVWDTMVSQLVYVAAYIGGMRFLIEVQLAFLTRDEPAAHRILSN